MTFLSEYDIFEKNLMQHILIYIPLQMEFESFGGGVLSDSHEKLSQDMKYCFCGTFMIYSHLFKYIQTNQTY